MTTPTFERVLRGAISRQLEHVHVALPGRIESYDATEQRATVQPLVKIAHVDESGARQVDTVPPVPEVPVVFPGGGGFRVTFPIAAGDTVLLVFASASLERWLTLGGVVDPEDDRRHTLTDAIAIPGLRSFSAPLEDAPTDAISIGSDSGGPVIEIDDSEVRAGGGDALATKADLDSLKSWLDAHTHPDPSSGSTGSPSTPSPSPSGTSVLKGS